MQHPLLAMNCLRLDGEEALGLIGTISVLEWFLNLEYGQGLPRPLSIRRLTATGRLAFLPHPILTQLEEAAKLRNATVHGTPSARDSLREGTMTSGREREEMDAAISTAKVEEIIRLVFEVFRMSNLTTEKPRVYWLGLRPKTVFSVIAQHRPSRRRPARFGSGAGRRPCGGIGGAIPVPNSALPSADAERRFLNDPGKGNSALRVVKLCETCLASARCRIVQLTGATTASTAASDQNE